MKLQDRNNNLVIVLLVRVLVVTSMMVRRRDLVGEYDIGEPEICGQKVR